MRSEKIFLVQERTQPTIWGNFLVQERTREIFRENFLVQELKRHSEEIF